MSFPQRHHPKQVRLTTFNNEPMARLAEQRLRQAGIPCFIRSLHGGPGLWGSAYNLPHALYVHQDREMQARETLDLAPPKLAERESQQGSARPRWGLWLTVMVLTIAALILGIVVPLLSRLSG